MTSLPDKRLSFGMDLRIKFKTSQHGRVRAEFEITQVFVFQMKCDRFLQIRFYFVECPALGNYLQLKAFGYVIFLAFGDTKLDDSIHSVIVPSSSIKLQADFAKTRPPLFVRYFGLDQ